MKRNSKIFILGFILSFPLMVFFQNCSRTQEFALSNLEGTNIAAGEVPPTLDTPVDQVGGQIQLDDNPAHSDADDDVADRTQEQPNERREPAAPAHTEPAHLVADQTQEQPNERREPAAPAHTAPAPHAAVQIKEPATPSTGTVVKDESKNDCDFEEDTENDVVRIHHETAREYYENICKKNSKSATHISNKDKKKFEIKDARGENTFVGDLVQGGKKAEIKIISKYRGYKYSKTEKGGNKNKKRGPMVICDANIESLDTILGDIVLVRGNVHSVKRFKGNLIVLDGDVGDINGFIGQIVVEGGKIQGNVTEISKAVTFEK